uniref:B-cell receptor CD22 n=1 Tax=Paramormyrops kingsleyae TaxID=1676925 RepID=A0A3B3Q744_9TELE
MLYGCIFTNGLLHQVGPLGSEWGVEYSRNRLCAIRRSTVVIPCSYKYPDSLRVETVLWCNDEYCTKSFVFHSSNTDVRTEYRDRAEYLGNKEKNCTLQIKNITDKDAGVYTFRFMTNVETGKYTGSPGTTLTVDELKVVMTSQKEGKGVSEGDSVSLTCGTDSCSLSQSEFTWFKDDQQLPETQSTLHFRPACKYHSANYSCGLKGNRQTVSEEVNLSVEELKVVMTSSRANGTLREGDSVNLTCDTDSCSLSQSEFTWFKDNQTLPETQSTLHFSPISYHHTGKYSCALNGRTVAVSNKVNIIVEKELSTVLTQQCRTAAEIISLKINCRLYEAGLLLCDSVFHLHMKIPNIVASLLLFLYIMLRVYIPTHLFGSR